MAPIRKRRVFQKSRKWNWDVHETLSLLNAYDTEKKNFFPLTNINKRALWKKIANQLYPEDSPFRRTRDEVQKKWRNMCTALRHEMMRSKKKNGKGEHLLSPILSRVADIIEDEDRMRKGLLTSYVPEASSRAKQIIEKKVPSAVTFAKIAKKPAIINSTKLSTTVADSISVKENVSFPVPSQSPVMSTMEAILPTTVASDPCIMTDIPFIKSEPLSPIIPSEPQEMENTLQVQPKVVSQVKKINPQLLTFETPPSTNASNIPPPPPLRIISIVNPLSSTSSQNSVSNASPKLFLKPVNTLATIPNVPSSNLVVLGPSKPSVPLPPPLSLPSNITTPLSISSSLSNQQSNQSFIPPLPLLLQTRKPEGIKIADFELLKLETEKLVVAQEQLKIEREKLKLEREKIEIEKEKIQHAQKLFEEQKYCKRTLLENKKLMLKNKKLKTEIKKLTVESDLLSLQVKKYQNDAQS